MVHRNYGSINSIEGSPSLFPLINSLGRSLNAGCSLAYTMKRPHCVLLYYFSVLDHAHYYTPSFCFVFQCAVVNAAASLAVLIRAVCVLVCLVDAVDPSEFQPFCQSYRLLSRDGLHATHPRTRLRGRFINDALYVIANRR